MLSASNCKKDDTPQDYIVREGNQAFGAYLNDQPWIANYRDAGSGITPINVKMLWRAAYGYNYVWATAQKNNEEISFFIQPPLVVGRKQLNVATLPYPGPWPSGSYGMYRVYTPSKQFMTDNSVTGYIDIISCDTMNSKIEGRFEFEAINTSTNEKVKVTNGYFKLN